MIPEEHVKKFLSLCYPHQNIKNFRFSHRNVENPDDKKLKAP